MKILVVTTFYPEKDRNDLIQDTSVVHYFTKEWVKEENEVVVLHLYAHNFKNIMKYKLKKYGKMQEEKIIDGVKVYIMENQFFKRNAKRYLKVQQKHIANEINKLLKTKLKDFNPDALVVHFPSHFEGIIENLDLNCKKFATFHITDCNSLKVNKKSRKIIKNTYNHFIARSNSIKNIMNSIEYNPEFVANSGIDSSIIIKKEELENKHNTKLKVLYAGSFIKRKNVDVIIKALGQVKNKIDFEFIIIGDGKNANMLKELAVENKIDDKCAFLGRKQRKEVFDYMKQSDIFVMVSSNETLGLTYMEAMSQGCLTIGSLNEGIDGIIKNNQNGFLIEAGNVEQLAELIIRINEMTDTEKKKIQKNAILTINEMTSEKTAQNYINFIKSKIN